MSQPKMVYIQWRDAYDLPGTQGWMESIEEPVDCIIITVGHLIYENENFVVVAHSLHETGMFQGAFGIPKTCIVESHAI